MEQAVTQMMFWSPLPKLSPYWHWEDYKSGMFKPTDKPCFDEKLKASVETLSNAEKCLEAMRKVIREWPIATTQNLHDSTINRRPWLGRACCCIACNASDDVVRVAWWMLTEEQRSTANEIADKVIAEWESMYA